MGGHPPLFLAVRRSSHFCEMVVNFYASLSKRGRFSKAPSLKTSCFPCRGPRVSMISFSFRLYYCDALFGGVKRPRQSRTQYILSLPESKDLNDLLEKSPWEKIRSEWCRILRILRRLVAADLASFGWALWAALLCLSQFQAFQAFVSLIVRQNVT